MGTTVALWIFIGITLIVVGVIFVRKTYTLDELGAFLIVIGIAGIAIGFIYGGLLAFDRVNEQGIYQKWTIEQQDLEKALNNTTDKVVTAELYEKAIEFNKDLAYKQYLYERGGYIPFSGDYDWSAIPFVTIPQ